MFYHVQTHERIPLEQAVYFRQRVHAILNDPRGWGIPFEHVTLPVLLQLPKQDSFIIRLTPAKELAQKYAEFKDQQLSVANMTDRVIDINYCRWTEACPNQSQLPLHEYHQYVILHEVGHILGKHHPSPSQMPKQKEAPVMMQQTLGIHNYTPNSWPTKFDKNVL